MRSRIVAVIFALALPVVPASASLEDDCYFEGGYFDPGYFAINYFDETCVPPSPPDPPSPVSTQRKRMFEPGLWE